MKDKENYVEVFPYKTDIPNAILVDGKRLEQEIIRIRTQRIHSFFIGILIGFTLVKLI